MGRAALLALVIGLALPGAAAARDFPRGFLWGTAIAAFQTEAGGTPAHADPNSDWWVWSHDSSNVEAGRVSGDLVERGPGHWQLYERDAALARRRLGANAFRSRSSGAACSRARPRGRAHRASSTGSPTARPCATTRRSCVRCGAAG